MQLRIILVLVSYLMPAPPLENCIRYWQQQMQLEEWRIQLQVVAADELDSWTVGDIEPKQETKTATLRLMRHKDSRLPKHLALAEQRLTIVHEMVHLRKFATGEGNWRSERETDTEAGLWVRTHGRWREALVIEY